MQRSSSTEITIFGAGSDAVRSPCLSTLLHFFLLCPPFPFVLPLLVYLILSFFWYSTRTPVNPNEPVTKIHANTDPEVTFTSSTVGAITLPAKIPVQDGHGAQPRGPRGTVRVKRIARDNLGI